MENQDLGKLIEKLDAEMSKPAAGRNMAVVRTYLDHIKKTYQEERTELETLRHKIRHDRLTDLGNSTKLEETLSDYESQKKPMTIINLDLRGLKAVNDTYGYDWGTNLIKLAAQYISAQTTTRKSTDMVFRAGERADEFYILTEETDPNNVKKFIMRLTKNAEKHRLHIKHGDGYGHVYLEFYSGYGIYDGFRPITDVKREAHTGVVENKTEVKANGCGK